MYKFKVKIPIQRHKNIIIKINKTNKTHVTVLNNIFINFSIQNKRVLKHVRPKKNKFVSYETPGWQKSKNIRF